MSSWCHQGSKVLYPTQLLVSAAALSKVQQLLLIANQQAIILFLLLLLSRKINTKNIWSANVESNRNKRLCRKVRKKIFFQQKKQHCLSTYELKMTKYFTDYQYPSMNILELKMTKYFTDYQYPSMTTLEFKMTKYFTDYQYPIMSFLTLPLNILARMNRWRGQMLRISWGSSRFLTGWRLQQTICSAGQKLFETCLSTECFIKYRYLWCVNLVCIPSEKKKD